MRKLRELKQGVWYKIRTQTNYPALKAGYQIFLRKICRWIGNCGPLFRKKKALAIFHRVFHEAELRFVFEIQGRRLEGDLLTFYIRPEDGLQLPEIMKWMKQTFAQRYNRATGRTGHIWGDRYWSRILEGEPPEGGTGGRTGASANGDRPPRGKNEAAPCFPPISPRSAAPAPG